MFLHDRDLIDKNCAEIYRKDVPIQTVILSNYKKYNSLADIHEIHREAEELEINQNVMDENNAIEGVVD